MRGNYGDGMIATAAMQLAKHFGVNMKLVPHTTHLTDVRNQFDEWAINGGGSLGHNYQWHFLRRCEALATHLPVTVLPSSGYTSDCTLRHCKKVYTRDIFSHAYYENTELAPDLALGLVGTLTVNKLHTSHDILWNMRNDPERVQFKYDYPNTTKTNDTESKDVYSEAMEYMLDTSSYEVVITNRIHQAICGLLLGKETYLTTNCYWKNLGMHVTWLKDLGCKWIWSPDDIRSRFEQDWDSKPYNGPTPPGV
jgi:exopolysaccharide biosynthesis predicted pyruvyltransferase EpsI